MPRYFLEFKYDGTAYHGWQIQNNSNTVQAEINKSIQTILGQELATTGAGRTDTGVHADQMFCHFDLNEETNMPSNFVFRLNAVLPDDISINNIFPVNLDVHDQVP